MTRSPLFCALGVSLAACVLLRTSEARACSPPPPACVPPVRLFPSHGSTGPLEISGNLIYFKVLVDQPGGLALRTKDGQAIPASVRTLGKDRVFAPDAPVEPGLDLELEYTTVCPANGSLEPAQEVYSFRSWESRPINLRAPELEVYEQGVRYPGLANNESSFARLRYYSPDADASALHLMNHYVTVDGLEHRLYDDDGIPMIELGASCSPETTEPSFDTCGNVYRFGTGTHHVVAWSSVVGEDGEPETAELDLALRCGASTAATDEDVSTGGGCAISRNTTRRDGAPLLALLLGAGLFARRNRRSSATALPGDR